MMRQIAMSIFLSIVAVSVWAEAPQPVSALLEVSDVEAGEHYQHTSFEAELTVTNHASVAAKLVVTPVKKYDAVIGTPPIVEPGATGTVRVRVDVADTLGVRAHAFSIAAPEPFAAVVARVNVFAYSLLEDPNPTVEFGTLYAASKPEPISVHFESREVEDFRIAEVSETPAFVAATMGSDGKSVELAVQDGGRYGQNSGFVKLKTNSELQPQVWVKVTAMLYADVVPSSNPFAIDVARTGQMNEYALLLESRSGKSVRIERARIDGFFGKTQVVDCASKVASCKQVRFTVDGDQPAKRISGQIKVKFRGEKRELSVDVWGVLLDPKTKIVSLNDALEKAAESQAGLVTQSPATERLSDAIKRATSPTLPIQASDGTGPLIRWSVNNEKSIHAYVIYRANSASGPFVRANREFLYVMSEDGSGSSYAWRDVNAVKGTTYWYYVGYVQNDGKKIQLTSPQKVVAK